MKYDCVCPAVFLDRPNRFIARVELDGRTETVHVKNTGRCKELLLPGRTVWLAEGTNPARKTKYDLIAVDKAGLLVNMDAQAPNKVFAEWALAGGFVSGLTRLKPEVAWGSSRFDFYWEAGDRRGFAEAKGCTLEDGGLARFPDAPTERGVKHLRELAACRAEGYEAAVCFILQMEGMKQFSPNDDTHPAFGAALRAAAAAGVRVLAMECAVTPDTLTVIRPVPVML